MAIPSAYIGSMIVTAEARDTEDEAGFMVFYPDGYCQWMAADRFLAQFRLVNRHERKAMAMTDAEAAMSRISDPVPADCKHVWTMKSRDAHTVPMAEQVLECAKCYQRELRTKLDAEALENASADEQDKCDHQWSVDYSANEKVCGWCDLRVKLGFCV